MNYISYPLISLSNLYKSVKIAGVPISFADPLNSDFVLPKLMLNIQIFIHIVFLNVKPIRVAHAADLSLNNFKIIHNHGHIVVNITTHVFVLISKNWLKSLQLLQESEHMTTVIR